MKFQANRVAATIDKLQGLEFLGVAGGDNLARFVTERMGKLGFDTTCHDNPRASIWRDVSLWKHVIRYTVVVLVAEGLLLRTDYFSIGLAALILLAGIGELGQAIARFSGVRNPEPTSAVFRFVLGRPRGASRAPVRVVFTINAVEENFDRPGFWGELSPGIVVLLHLSLFIQVILRCIGAQWSIYLAFLAALAIGMMWYRAWRSIGLRYDRDWRPDCRTVAALTELAATWPRGRLRHIEAVFMAAVPMDVPDELLPLPPALGTKPTLHISLGRLGVGDLRVAVAGKGAVEAAELVKAAATSLWIPIALVTHKNSDCGSGGKLGPLITLDGSRRDGNEPIDPRSIEPAIQLTTEIALRWSKRHERALDLSARAAT
jgi:hypothetical protein